MNIKIGKVGAAGMVACEALFAGAMVIDLVSEYKTTYFSYFICILLPIAYIMLSSALAVSCKDKRVTAAGIAGVAFAVVYAVLVCLVYYSMVTTVRTNSDLSGEALSIISFERLGSLFFNYDMLGYGFMGLSTFFIGFTIHPRDKGDRALRNLLWIHGVFFLTGLIMPLFPLFTPETPGGDVIGTAVLLVWCAYIIPTCALGYRYFRKN
ncbi:MAG: hypothetical protein LBH17_07580 [Oscillospiraceae bacterium]|jgi:hypothetical protein|nr:hypothetical protein [Oscillospiraceae bacterium]